MASSQISIETDKYEDSANWENQDNQLFDIKIPFRPSVKSEVLADAHYFPSPDNRTRLLIREVDNVPSPKYTNSALSLLTFEYLENWHAVCKQSLDLVKNNKSIYNQWKRPITGDRIGQLQAAHKVIKSYYNDININSDKFEPSKDHKVTKNLIPNMSAILRRSFPNNQETPPTSPEVLYALYQSRRMNRLFIDKHILHKPTDKNGRSASLWEFENLVDLCCIPLFNVGMEGIIPGKPTSPTSFKAMSEEVENKINECYIVKRILNEVKMATKMELSKFTTTHVSWFLLNPWCLFFSTLRDLLTRKEAELGYYHVNASLRSESLMIDEDKVEPSSEQLLHRFMEIILILFSILCGNQDEFRSTPGRVNEKITVGTIKCEIQDDGYIYVCRGGTSGHYETTNWKGQKEFRATHLIGGKMVHVPSDRNRYGKTPVIRYEAKRLDMSSNVHSQIFSELLSAAILNRKYMKVSDPNASILDQDIIDEMNERKKNKEDPSAPYHDSFVIHIHHYTLTIHTARFPTDYLKWVTDETKGNEPNKNYCILYKVSDPYNLSQPDDRLAAARDILTLLWAIKKSKPTKDGSSLFVARAVMRQSIGAPKLSDRNIRTSTRDQRDNQPDNARSKSLPFNKYGNSQSSNKQVFTNAVNNQASNTQPTYQAFNKQGQNQLPNKSLHKVGSGQQPYVSHTKQPSDELLSRSVDNLLSIVQPTREKKPPGNLSFLSFKTPNAPVTDEPQADTDIMLDSMVGSRPFRTDETISNIENNSPRSTFSEKEELNQFLGSGDLSQRDETTSVITTNKQQPTKEEDRSKKGGNKDRRRNWNTNRSRSRSGNRSGNRSRSRSRSRSESKSRSRNRAERNRSESKDRRDKGRERSGSRNRGGRERERSKDRKANRDRIGGRERSKSRDKGKRNRSGSGSRSRDRGERNRSESQDRRDRDRERSGSGSRSRSRSGSKSRNRGGRERERSKDRKGNRDRIRDRDRNANWYRSGDGYRDRNANRNRAVNRNRSGSRERRKRRSNKDKDYQQDNKKSHVRRDQY